MHPFPKTLSVSSVNRLNSFLPIRNKGNEFSWDTISGMVLSALIRKEIRDYGLPQFQEDCERRFSQKMIRGSSWELLRRMYFDSVAIYKVSPLFLLFKSQRNSKSGAEIGAADIRMTDLFTHLMGDLSLDEELGDSLNFLEMELLEVLKENLSTAAQPVINERPYLPYISDAFRRDLEFLASHPKYLLQELKQVLSLYAFTYSAQLALNLGEWRNGEPKPKPLYFILDTESASSERNMVRTFGFSIFRKASERLFPYLSALEVFQGGDVKVPLWQLYEQACSYPDQGTLINALNSYAEEFAESRRLNLYHQALTPAISLDTAFENILFLAQKQFDDADSYREDINKKYVKELQSKLCVNFMQSRGRAGRVLVLNQDQLLLLTNLAVGKNREKLRFHELVEEFKVRGFFLDNQSQQALVNFYERMGNAERMSDSGDAVYVRKTI